MSATAADYDAVRQHGGIADLSDRAKFRLTGADRVRYLNGQVTNNLLRLGSEAALPVCVTTAKGKLSADAFVSNLGDGLLLDAAPELRDSLAPRLERYIIADDVVLEDATDELRLLHLLPCSGKPIESLLRTGFGALAHRRARRFGQDGIDFLLPADDADAVSAALFASHPLIAPELLELLRIEAGVPRWGAELGEDTLPPEAGLDRTHIDYHKGCYIGQEVISRLKGVGHVNRHLTGFTSISGEALAPGLRIFAAGDDAKSLGQLTSTAWSFALSKPIALGYLRHGSAAADLVARPASSGGPALPVAVCPLPFLS